MQSELHSPTTKQESSLTHYFNSKQIKKGTYFLLSKCHNWFFDVSSLTPMFPEASLFATHVAIPPNLLDHVITHYWLLAVTKRLPTIEEESVGNVDNGICGPSTSSLSPTPVSNHQCQYETQTCYFEEPDKHPGPSQSAVFQSLAH
ncbi:hypothetical protein E6O75_ATG01573 [Venturia nashicola]|uniref:Uncharacterized protein n=1 Tax=Venturia nashicola TaxID=86259 RepID=A0A4Z1PE74_9PEZI|nr:hypothetical protein E6O75_ATG01573 [Venturia nashicola]